MPDPKPRLVAEAATESEREREFPAREARRPGDTGATSTSLVRRRSRASAAARSGAHASILRFDAERTGSVAGAVSSDHSRNTARSEPNVTVAPSTRGCRVLTRAPSTY